MCIFAVLTRTLDGLRPSITQEGSISTAKFVALRVPAEVVVVVENEDLRVFRDLLTVEVCGRKTADTATHNNQIVVLRGIFWVSINVPGFAIAQPVRVAEASVVIATHP